MNWLKRKLIGLATRKTLMEVLTMPSLAGYRTYLVAAAYVLLNFLDAAGLIPGAYAEMLNDVEKMLLGTGLITLRAAKNGS